jgi:hypothetical protein
VWLCVGSGYLKEKQFDVDLEWFSRYRNAPLSVFQSITDFKQVLGGRSVWPVLWWRCDVCCALLIVCCRLHVM